MKTSYKWIKDLVPGLDADIKEYCDAMTMSGTKVEFYNKMDECLEGIVIGQIDKIDPHPDADKLVICQVDIGKEKLQIVTGASNVFPGAKIPVVVPGGRVAGTHSGGMAEGGVKIKEGKLRGVDSFGMLCSIEELGSDTNVFPDADPDGIYILKDDAPVGEDAIVYLGLDDTVIEYEVTSNRVDCYSVLGIAREAAATFRLPFAPPKVNKTGNSEDANSYIKVSIEDKNYCKRYVGRVVKNIKIGPSPEWMRKRLISQGIRPINNIVDITNYVMEEYGQPMHAYDLSTIEGGEIIVKNAKDGDTFVTLDGQERKLDSQMVMINDGKKAVGIGGIMGGENSMITDTVETMLFEAACFYGANIRQSAKRLGMRTEASSIFEKGLDPENAMLAMERACSLIEELGAGEVVGGAVDVYPVHHESITLPFMPDKYNSLLGTDISREDQLKILNSVEITLDESKKILHIPGFRQDLLCQADIAEEIARFFGYDKIPVTLPKGSQTNGGRPIELQVAMAAEDALLSYGFSEAYCYSFESPKVFDKLLYPADAKERQAVSIQNPLGEDFSIMRTTPAAGMLTSLSTNSLRRNGETRLFERGNIYIPKQLPPTELLDEIPLLTFGMIGSGDFFDLKGAFEGVLLALGLRKRPRYEECDIPYLHPGRRAIVKYGKDEIGYLGEVHPLAAEKFSIKERAYIAVINLNVLCANAGKIPKYSPITNFPKSTRDLSMLVPVDIKAGQIEETFVKKGGKYLESFKLFDIYEGEQVEKGYKSMAYSLVFRAEDRSLSDEDVNETVNGILLALEKSGVSLRS